MFAVFVSRKIHADTAYSRLYKSKGLMREYESAAALAEDAKIPLPNLRSTHTQRTHKVPLGPFRPRRAPAVIGQYRRAAYAHATARVLDAFRTRFKGISTSKYAHIFRSRGLVLTMFSQSGLDTQAAAARLISKQQWSELRRGKRGSD